MRASYSLGSLLSIDEILECTKIIPYPDTDTIWIPETWGMENFAMLAAISQITKTCRIGSSIINIYSRSPALIGMGAATLDMISKGRLILGLGTSSIPIVEQFHGYKFDSPLSRMREYVEIINKTLSKDVINHSGDTFNLKDFKLLIKPYRNKIPIYMAAVNEKMTNLAWDMADGVIFYLKPISEIQNVTKLQSRKIDVSCQIITSISEDADIAIRRAKKTLAFYIAVGGIYRDYLSYHGYNKETTSILEEFKKSKTAQLYHLVSDRMLNDLALAGTPEHCQKHIKKFLNAGVTHPILQFNPNGNTIPSFKLLTKTFSGEI